MKRLVQKTSKLITAIFALLLTQAAMAQYCTPDYTTGVTDGDYIDRVVLGSIDNTTGDDGGLEYVDHTALSTDLTADMEYTLTVYNCPSWSEATEAWIDYDQDGTFEEDESVGCSVISGGGSYDFVFTVPGSALDGTTRMRVMCEYAGPCSLDPCSISYPWGQTEDYSVVISGGGGPISGCTDEAALNYDPDAEEDDGSCVYPYTIATCDYSSLLSSDGTTLSLGDDAISSAVSLGFTFPFYGTDYTECYIVSNGYMSFTAPTLSGCCSGQILPNASYPNSIFFGQEDLDPNSGIDGTISYYTTGDPGSQIFVMSFVDVPHYPGPVGTYPVTVQVQLYEATGEIRIVTTEYNSDGGFSTMGLNWDGDYAQPVEGRNSEDWSAYEECIVFLPYGTEVETCDYLSAPTGLYADDITATTATLHWDAVPYATKYIIKYFVADVSPSYRQDSYTNSLAMPGVLAPETTYGFRVKTVCYDDGISPLSDAYYFTTGPLKSGEFMKEVKMYPNPNNGTFKLQITGYENKDVDVMIVNAVGQVVYQNTLTVNEFTHVEDISLAGIASGMYQLRIVDGETVSTESLIIE